MAIPKIAPYRYQDALAPVEQKVDWQINAKDAVLLIHDMQAYFADFYDNHQEPISTLVANIQKIIATARRANIPVIYTAQPTNQDPKERALLTDFWGTGLKDSHQSQQILSALAPQAYDQVYTKWRYSAFQKSSLESDLKTANKKQIIICGIYAHIGVLSTALDGFMRDFQSFVIEDAVADFSAEEHFWARKWIAGRCGKLITTATAEQQMQANTKPHFDLDGLVSQLLETPISDIKDTDHLADWGLDSIRLMTLADQLKAAGINIDFMTLGENPMLKHWRDLIKP